MNGESDSPTCLPPRRGGGFLFSHMSAPAWGRSHLTQGGHSMSAIPQNSIVSQVEGWQAGFLAVLPAIQTHARIVFRHLPRERREDAVQEVVASACVSYQVLAAKGKLDVAHPGSLATFAVRHVRNGRHVGGSQDAARDVLSKVAQRRHSFEISSYEGQTGQEDDWRQVALEDRKTPIPDLAAFRIDFAQWLRTLSDRDRRIINAFISGEPTWA